ncbi:MAG: ATP-binding protein [Flavobacteriales bacterium]|nr:ATP-binding protein [Flavobacteriales bacterium]
MYVGRELIGHMRYIISKFPAMSVMGPRQSGKSSLIKNEFSDFAYFNLEDIQLRELVASDIKGFLANNGQKIAIDEAQNLPELFSYVQLAVDNDPDKRIILSGSQSFLLHEKIAQSLAGRIGITRLLPFSVKELKAGRFETSDLAQLIFTGGYPRIYDQNINPIHFYPNYIQTYVERDLRTLSNIGDLTLFDAFVRLCAGRVGQIINYSSMANDLGVSLNTIKNWISILKTSFIAFELKPYYRNFSKRTVKSGKLYFYDTGLVCSLLGMTDKSQYQTHFLKGGLFENFVIVEVLKHFYNQVKEPKLYFWQDSNKNEVDCIVEVDGNTFSFEIKAGATWNKDFAKYLIKWNDLTGFDAAKSAVVYGGSEEIVISGVRFLPWFNFLKQFEIS